MKMKHVVGALVICMMAATAAQAGTWVKWDSVNPVEVVNIPGGVYAGVYNLSVMVDPVTPPTQGSTTPGGTPTPSWCVDVVGHSQGTWQPYDLVSLETHMTAAKAKDIGQLLDLAFTIGQAWTSVGNSYAASVQAAVWEIVNETGAYGLGDGSWQTTGNVGTITQANTWLTTINNDNTNTPPDTGGMDDLSVCPNLKMLYNEEYQDYAIVRKTADPVPEPLTMASAFLAIAGLGGYIRRRTGRAAA
jgi:hypothetical protein